MHRDHLVQLIIHISSILTMKDPRPNPDQHDAQKVNAAGANARERTTAIPVIQEHVEINKEWIGTGKVKVTKTVSENEETVTIPLQYEEVEVKRVVKGQLLDQAPPPVRHEGDTTIFPVLREVMVKRLLLVEELHVTQKTVQRDTVEHVTLLKEEVNVDRMSASGSEGRDT